MFAVFGATCYGFVMKERGGAPQVCFPEFLLTLLEPIHVFGGKYWGLAWDCLSRRERFSARQVYAGRILTTFTSVASGNMAGSVMSGSPGLAPEKRMTRVKHALLEVSRSFPWRARPNFSYRPFRARRKAYQVLVFYGQGEVGLFLEGCVVPC